MILDREYNYIVSGLERSGTSMLMQMLKAGEIPISFDKSRKPDENNPKGYFELEGGKIINKLMEDTFPLDLYLGEFIKITAFGLKFLPLGKYKIIYSERNLEEILDSMEKMTGKKDIDRLDIRTSFEKLNSMIKDKLISRNDVDVLFINYNNILEEPEKNIKKIGSFLNIKNLNIEEMVSVIDPSLYRQRRSSVSNIV